MQNNNNNAEISQRYTTQELAHIEIYGKTGRILSKMGNLSRSGALFEVMNANGSFKKGDLARVTVRLKSLNKIHVVDCEVVWSKGPSVGVQFLNKDELQDKLANYVLNR